MAFMKYAAASVVRPQVSGRSWSKVRKASKGDQKALPTNLIAQASEILGKPFDPAEYLLSHATIVASVDVENVPNVKLGSITEDGQRIMRKYSDYRVTTGTQKWLNNNWDGWSRGVLRKSYKGFIGGMNFQEHVQLEELSKGRIIDAVARDIGPSVYVDILVATERRHTKLIEDILSGKIATLSMGCFLPGTQVSLANGIRIPIEDVQIGDVVLTHTGKESPVKSTKRVEGEALVRSIKAFGLPSSITATLNHEFFVVRPQSHCACGCGELLDTENQMLTRRIQARFKKGHQFNVYNANNPLKNSQDDRDCLEQIKGVHPEWVKAEDIQVGDFLSFPKGNDREMGEGQSVGKARLLGYFLAEGCYIKHKGSPVEVQFHFGLHEEKTFAAEVASLLQQEFPDANAPWIQNRAERTTCTVHCTGRDMVQWFYQNAGEYSHGKRISDDVMSWPNHLLVHVAGSWMNGDGGRVEGAIRTATVSYSLASQMQLIMSRCGVYSTMRCSLKGKPTPQRVVDVVDEQGIGIRDVESRRLPVFWITVGKTEKQKLAEATTLASSDASLQTRFNSTDDYLLYRVASIEEFLYEGTVYDLGVEDEDHSYIVEGAAVHNCLTEETCCTKCGHVAADETELCSCVKFFKGSTFYADDGYQGKVAELCGHESLENGGVTFIEASWVETPAFTGAVLRNVLEADNISPEVIRKAEKILSTTPAQWQEDKYKKAANAIGSLKTGDWGDEEEAEADAPADDGGGDSFGDLESDIEKMVLDKVKRKVRERLQEDQMKDVSPEDSTAAPNDNIVKQAIYQERRDVAYRAAILALARTASSDIEFMEKLAMYNNSVGIQIPVDVYRQTLKVGSSDNYVVLKQFLDSCRAAFGRMPKFSEQGTLIRLGKYLSRRGEN
jgi:hypothetical protein